jgi:hypothetical protein
MNIVEIIMHRAGMENPQVIITFPVTVRTFHRQSPNLLSLSAIGVLADVVGLSYFIVWRFLRQEGSAERWLIIWRYTVEFDIALALQLRSQNISLIAVALSGICCLTWKIIKGAAIII